MSKAVVIFSGGQDSTTCLFWALKNFTEVEAITFNYGQKHAIELECAKHICQKANVKQIVIDMTFLGTIVDSALTSGGDVNEIKNGLPASFVPNRNALFITLAHAYAQKISASAIVGGMCQTDFSGYPDCRQLFITMFGDALDTGSGADIEILTPLMNISKAETFQLAESLGCLDRVIAWSHTCYNGDRKTQHAWGKGCGECPACLLRKKGYEEYLEIR